MLADSHLNEPHEKVVTSLGSSARLGKTTLSNRNSSTTRHDVLQGDIN